MTSFRITRLKWREQLSSRPNEQISTLCTNLFSSKKCALAIDGSRFQFVLSPTQPFEEKTRYRTRNKTISLQSNHPFLDKKSNKLICFFSSVTEVLLYKLVLQYKH
ncbi:hypothetical protein TNIN_118241 [Trichonephila inaurata madagascariensis]|uniref:Uncharacterized protein n=1 Tax=Trichonephila inaurata madagascariensis TaxID=2747483 RepID=A0A8X7CJK4_9ARAC|nr:hypothetical protein TNIN_118241 [Trichonephila inaurata madagascariensis]